MRYFRKKKNDYVSPCDQLMQSVRKNQKEPTETQRLEREKHDAIFAARDHVVNKPTPNDPFASFGQDEQESET